MIYKKVIVLSILLSSLLVASPYPEPILYVHPTPNSAEVTLRSTIILKVSNSFKSLLKPSLFSFEVKGSKSGQIEGNIKIIRNTIIFKPNNQFMEEELISAIISSQKLEIDNFFFSFQTSKITDVYNDVTNPNIKELKPLEKVYSKTDNKTAFDEPTIINGVAVPNDFPILQPLIDSTTTAPGKLFLSIAEDRSPYLMILENDGTPYFYRKVERRTRDFKFHPNTGQLSRMVWPVSGHQNNWEVLDSNYNRVGLYKSQNGYQNDDHEFIITNDGTYLMIVRNYEVIDSSGNLYTGNHIQEADLATEEVVFQWNSWDHLNPSDAYYGGADYVHMNSIAVDYDSNLVISCRNMNQCLKIDRTTGEIIWRLGGKKNEFSFKNVEDKFASQHDIQPVPNKPNNYTIFDNRGAGFSRGIEYKLDLDSMTAEKVWEFKTVPPRSAGIMGNVQRLTNGNTLVNWASSNNPKPTEVTPTGEIVFDANFSIRSTVYRAFRFEWKGMLLEPYLIAEPSTSKIRLIFNKFGDTSVVSYNIYADSFEDPTSLIANTDRTWFDINTNTLTNKTNYYFRVTAQLADSKESPFSNTEMAFVNYIKSENNIAVLGNSISEDGFDPIWYKDTTDFQSSLLLDGLDDYVNCGNNFGLPISGNEVTIEARIKVSSWKDNINNGYILAKENSFDVNSYEGYAIRVGDNGKISFKFGGDANNISYEELSTEENTLSLNQWFHIAVTYNSNIMKIFVDGNKKASKTQTINIRDAIGKPLYIGSPPHFANKTFNGIIDDVRLWNVARSESDIQSTMNGQLDVEYYTNENSGLVGYWQLNEGEGQIISDLVKSDNLILNGNFDYSDDYWIFSKTSEIQADVNIADHYFVDIINGGTTQSDINISQNNVSLNQGEKYILKFDGWAENDKFIDVKVRRATSPFTDYSRIGAVYLNSTEQSQSFPFEMNEISDGKASLIFMVGGDEHDIHIDNISLKLDITTDISEFIKLENNFSLTTNYPNPFNPTTQIEYFLPEKSLVSLTIYNTLGQKLSTYINAEQSAGRYKKELDLSNFSSGIYFYSLEAKVVNSAKYFQNVKKMILLK